jgi:hypothetical protein
VRFSHDVWGQPIEIAAGSNLTSGRNKENQICRIPGLNLPTLGAGKGRKKKGFACAEPLAQ